VQRDAEYRSDGFIPAPPSDPERTHRDSVRGCPAPLITTRREALRRVLPTLQSASSSLHRPTPLAGHPNRSAEEGWATDTLADSTGAAECGHRTTSARASGTIVPRGQRLPASPHNAGSLNGVISTEQFHTRKWPNNAMALSRNAVALVAQQSGIGGHQQRRCGVNNGRPPCASTSSAMTESPSAASRSQ
jgi:hypothetical protein